MRTVAHPAVVVVVVKKAVVAAVARAVMCHLLMREAAAAVVQGGRMALLVAAAVRVVRVAAVTAVMRHLVVRKAAAVVMGNHLVYLLVKVMVGLRQAARAVRAATAQSLLWQLVMLLGAPSSVGRNSATGQRTQGWQGGRAAAAPHRAHMKVVTLVMRTAQRAGTTVGRMKRAAPLRHQQGTAGAGALMRIAALGQSSLVMYSMLARVAALTAAARQSSLVASLRKAVLGTIGQQRAQLLKAALRAAVAMGELVTLGAVRMVLAAQRAAARQAQKSAAAGGQMGRT
jgi:hypothetical protein